jgi:hypothetical protein
MKRLLLPPEHCFGGFLSWFLEPTPCFLTIIFKCPYESMSYIVIVRTFFLFLSVRKCIILKQQSESEGG